MELNKNDNGQEKKPYSYTFKVPKIGKNNKPVKTEAGDPVYDTFIYKFDLMGMDRKLMGRRYFELAEKIISNLPKEPDHLEIMAERKSELKGYSAILMKVNEEGGFELYDPVLTEFTPYIWSQLGKSDAEFEALEACKADFFIKVGLQFPKLIMQSNNTIMQSLNIMKELSALGTKAGIEGKEDMKELMQMILKAATNMDTDSSQETISEESSIDLINTETGSEILSTGE